MEPPRETAVLLMVIELFASSLLAMEESVKAPVELL